MPCICDLVLKRPCGICLANDSCDPQLCPYCGKLDKLRIQAEEKRAIDDYNALYNDVRYNYVITLSSPPDRTYDDFMDSVDRVLKQKYMLSGKIGYELHKHGGPHCHIGVLTDRKLHQPNIKRLNNGYNVQVKRNNKPKEVWEEYLSKAKTDAEIQYFFYNHPEEFDMTLVDTF